ncbi:MAG: ABC transporter substrate-binding protein [Caldilineaceae bacterium]|nr:ABC transporter substrate-binding protein [Caldilineaceae bacterium]
MRLLRRTVYLCSAMFLILLMAACQTPAVPVSEAATDTTENSGTEAATETSAVESALEVTDIAGRTVVISQPVEKILLGEARQIYVIAALEQENPFARVVGWNDDFQPNDLNTYQLYLEKFPEMADIPNLGSVSNGEFNVELAITLEPDLLVLALQNLNAAQETGLLDQLEAVGIPVIFIDYRDHPLENTIPSTILLGEILGRQAEATEIVAFYDEHIDPILARAAEIAEEDKPTVFFERAAGLSDCCATWGSESLGHVAELVGAINIGTEILGTPTGTINPEQVIVSDPEIYILTGANWSLNTPDNRAVYFGAGGDPLLIQEQLQRLASRPGYETLQSVQNLRFHGLWHQFYNSPYYFVAFELIAQWVQPEVFAYLDPEATFKEFHEQFLPIDYVPGYWATLEAAD